MDPGSCRGCSEHSVAFKDIVSATNFLASQACRSCTTFRSKEVPCARNCICRRNTLCGWGFGAAVGDYDNDGKDDLYLTYLDGALLYRNNGDGTFTDVTSKAGVGNAGRWGTSASFGDYDNDGHLDLYVANYVDIDLDHLPEPGESPLCTYRGFAVSCGPRGLKGSRDRLYHNNGDGTFADVTEKLNIDPGSYYGLGVLWLDYDLGGCLDRAVSDDSSPSLLYHNDCKGGSGEV